MAYWVIYYKCTAQDTSSIRHDDAEYYLNKAVVLADSENEALGLLSENLEADQISIQETLEISKYENFNLTSDLFEVEYAYN